MSQDATPHQTLASTSEGFSVESYADRLMDELFGDVEQALDMGMELQPRPAEPQSHTTPPPFSTESEPAPEAQPAQTPLPLILPLAMPETDRAANHAVVLDERPAIATSAGAIAVPEPDTSRPRASRLVDRLILGLSCISVIVILAVWLFKHEAARSPTVSPPPPPTALNPNTASDQQFAEYVQRALQTIGPKATPNSVAALPTVSPSPTPAMPTVTLPAVPAAPTTLRPLKPATGRLQIPAYPVPTNLSPPTNPVAPLPKVATAPVKPPVPLSVPGIAHTLVGVMELGDRSAALIEINGIVQRFKLGESIGSSGWTLVEVSKDQAVMRRNGEVRSIFIGQNF